MWLTTCFPKWTQYRFKSQLHIGFTLFNLAVLAAIFITIFVFTFVSTANSESHLRNRLNDVAQDYTRAIATDSARVFDRLLTRYARNFLNIIGNSASEFRRTDHPYPLLPAYYEWKDTMKPPLVNDSRYNSLVSFEDGGYSVATKSPYNVSTFPAILNATIGKSEAIMPLMKNLYFTNSEFLGGYYCLSVNSWHVFREFPAASNGNYSQMTAYDCIRDDWYLTGRTAGNPRTGYQVRTTSFSSVYVDRWVKQAMITIIQPIFDPTTSTLIGVAGADLLTQNLQASINNVKYLQHGRSILFEVPSGSVISDTARQAGFQQTTLQWFYQLNSPSISSDLWNQIYQLDSLYRTTSTFTEIDDWYIAGQPLASGNNQYLLVIFVWKQDVVGILDPVLSDISTARKTAILVNSIVCLSVLLIAALVNILLANRIVRPLKELTDDSAKMIEHIGDDSGLANGIIVRKADSEVSETRQLQMAHRAMIEAIQSQHAAAAAAQQQAAQRIDYALPAYAPGQAFDQSVLIIPGGMPMQQQQPQVLVPVGVIMGPGQPMQPFAQQPMSPLSPNDMSASAPMIQQQPQYLQQPITIASPGQTPYTQTNYSSSYNPTVASPAYPPGPTPQYADATGLPSYEGQSSMPASPPVGQSVRFHATTDEWVEPMSSGKNVFHTEGVPSASSSSSAASSRPGSAKHKNKEDKIKQQGQKKKPKKGGKDGSHSADEMD